MEITLIINVHEAKSDHDGYCSGEECVYTCEEDYTEELVNVYHDIPNSGILRELYERTDTNINKLDMVKELFADRINTIEQSTDVNLRGSYFCTLSEESKELGFGRHEGVITVNPVTYRACKL